MADKHHWGDSGILRGKKPEEDDLLVFGYSCKLFRDDEKALFIDQGKHLIPWMGDETLKIDRYDGRAALPDLRQFEAGLDFDFMAALSEGERRVETLCDEESLRPEIIEEELKRLQQALAGQHKQYGAVQYAYDEESQRTVQVEPGSSSKDDEDEDTPFVAPPELDIPLNMALPPSNKLHAIIERTAGFIAKQGGQMEVLLKAKQSGNAQFGFLSYDHDLHPYYKLLLAAIRAGRYKLREPQNNDEEEDDEEDDEDDHYLHPSLASSTKIDLAPAIPSITYRPSANCAYSMLVTKIKGKQAAMPPQEQPPVPTLPVANMEQLAPVVPMPVIPQVPILQPPQDLQLVIDKMAAYVAKNGPEFEDVVRNKGDPRFSFLDPSHIYHPYYRERMRDLSGNRDHGRSVPTPVSFSIRPQAGDGMLETRSALEETGERPRPGEAYMATALQSVADVPLPTVPPREPENLDKDEQERRQAAIQRSKIAEERLRAKLMAAARERMASASKEKQVQQERKRKVAAFLSRLALEKRQIIKPEPPVIIGPQLPPELQPPPEVDQDEVRSIPSPSPSSSPSPPPPPSMSITPPPPPTIGSQPDLVPVPRKPTSPRSNGDRKRHRSKSPASQVSSSSSRKHKHHHKHSSNPKHHRRHRSRSPSTSSGSHRKQRRQSPPPRKSHKKRSRNSPSPSSPKKSNKEKRKARSSSSDSVVSASSSSSSSSA
ncbi:hypothetical protein B566_EDAN005309 [Ephemera danica]|nr:hypothetical protein B566_EDAN005309 [Ephemera danica]